MAKLLKLEIADVHVQCTNQAIKLFLCYNKSSKKVCHKQSGDLDVLIY